MKLRLVFILLLLLVAAGSTQAQTDPAPNVEIKIPDGWESQVAPNGSLAITNNPAAATVPLLEPLPEDAVFVTIGTPFDINSLIMNQGGDYLLGQFAIALITIGGGINEDVSVPPLERVPELDTNSITITFDSVPATFWVIAVPTKEKDVVMLALVKGEGYRDEIIQMLLTAELARPYDS